MKQKLNAADYAWAAQAIGVDIASIKAVCQIEAPRGGFLLTDEPTILFERHKFSEYTQGRYDKTHPDISNPDAGGYGLISNQHARLQKAVALDREAALKAASWGKFQILGVNYQKAGYVTLQAFVNAMYRSERDHLEAFVQFIKSDAAMWTALKQRKWDRFAHRYNGPAYKKHDYDKRLSLAYDQLRGVA